MPFANGENVGAYRIVEKLGQGGMATVYKAYHPALDRYVAIKVMHPAFTEDPNFLARFQREARIVAKLDHPHIVPIYDFAEHHKQPYLVMRFIEGETLKARLERGPLEPQEVLRIAQAVGEALTYAHGQGVLHRDIKPSNILITPDGSVYLTDFGLARMAEAGESTLSRDMMVGTPQYISPEQAKGMRELDHRTDIYSLGVVLYELLVGQAPFTADTPYAIIHDHIFTPLPLPRDLNPDLPEALERVLLKALAKEPADRFQAVEELVSALDTALKPASAPPPPEIVVAPPPAVDRAVESVQRTAEEERPREEKEPRKRKHRRRSWAVAGVAAFLCLIVAGVGLGVIVRRRQAALAPGPDNAAEQLLEEARTAREGADTDLALDLYQQAVEADPHLIPAYTEAGELLVQIGEIDRAIDTLTGGLKANPDSPELHKRVAGIALVTKRLDAAQREMEWLLREMPEEAISHAYAGLLTLAQGQPCEEARPELERALRLDPELAWTHYGLAACYLQEGNPEAARAELELVLGQEGISELLRKRAEDLLIRLEAGDAGDKEAIEREFEELFPLAGEIADDDLRRSLEEMLDQAHRAWEQGDELGAIQMLKDAHGWVKENRDALGDPPAGELDMRIDHIIRLAVEP